MNFGYITLNHILIVRENEKMKKKKKANVHFKYIHEP